MPPVFDASAYFTRRQSDARYVPLPAAPGPPVSVALSSTAIVETSTELYATATFDVTPPVGWSTGITGYQFQLTDPNSNVTLQTLSPSNPLTLIDLLINTVYSVQVLAIDF